MIRIKRAYEPASKQDGVRILVDRLWPRGLSKARFKLDRWEKDIAPSNALRIWFGHDPGRWAEFERRYRTELRSHKKELAELRLLSKKTTVTLVFGAKDVEHNQAIVLKKVLSSK